MNLNKTYRHCAIASIVMGVALITFAYPYQLQDFLNVIRGLQITATAALLFAILKKEPKHKDKIILFWLAITALFFTSLGFCSLNYITEDFNGFESIFVVIAEWLAMAVVGFMMYVIYQEYLELTQINRAGLTLPPVANVFNPVLETKENPPPYIPTSENLTVSIQS